jgi:hypothetical protein
LPALQARVSTPACVNASGEEAAAGFGSLNIHEQQRWFWFEVVTSGALIIIGRGDPRRPE